MRRALLAVGIALFLSGTAHADDTAAATPASKTVDSHLAAALDLLDANGSMTSMANMLDALAPLEAQEIKHQNPSADDATIAAVQKVVRDALVAREDEYKQVIAAVYESHFSEDELKTLAAFYRSDVGKKYIGTLPIMIKEMVPLGSAWAKQVAEDALAKAMTQLHVKGDQT